MKFGPSSSGSGASLGPSTMECCDCGGLLCDQKTRRLIVMSQEQALANENKILEEHAAKGAAKNCKGETSPTCPIVCPTCAKVCKTQAGLLNHIRLTHEKDKNG